MKRKPTNFISEQSEQRIRQVLTHPGTRVAAVDLVRGIMAASNGGCNRQMAYASVAQGERSGMLVSYRIRARKAYALAPGWQRPAPKNRPNAGERWPAQANPPASIHNTLARMPAHRPGPLVPSLGTRPDPEVMPPEVHSMISGLFRRIFEHSVGVE